MIWEAAEGLTPASFWIDIRGKRILPMLIEAIHNREVDGTSGCALLGISELQTLIHFLFGPILLRLDIDEARIEIVAIDIESAAHGFAAPTGSTARLVGKPPWGGAI